MSKYSHKLPKDDLKKFAKEVGKKLVASDFKNKRVEDPLKISDKQEKKVKKYVRDYFDKAVEKRKMHDKKKAQKKERENGAPAKDASNGDGPASSTAAIPTDEQDDAKNDESDALPDPSDDEADVDTNDFGLHPPSLSRSPIDNPTILNPELKRKRDGEDEDDHQSETGSTKRLKSEAEDSTPPPPPPPPPPADGAMGGMDDEHEVIEETEEQRELRSQEEDLMRENEEAMAMDMDGSLKTEEMSRDAFASAQSNTTLNIKSDNQASNALGAGVNGSGSAVNGTGEITKADEVIKLEHERTEVLSH